MTNLKVKIYLFQAFIFWVVDNFLKQKRKGTKTIYVNDIGAKFCKTTDEVRCYNRIPNPKTDESDLLISTDDEPDARRRTVDHDIDRVLIA